MNATREHYWKLHERAVKACRAIYRRTGYDVAERACWYRWLRWLQRHAERETSSWDADTVVGLVPETVEDDCLLDELPTRKDVRHE